MLGVDNWKVKYLDLCNDVKCGENDGNSHRCSDYLQEDMLFFYHDLRAFSLVPNVNPRFLAGET